ncbi:uncharacterized protein G2W53_001308 [Senna tora]|uniref:Uncharacterized protein n=1 Tax=Senna tora TaxID=362788 RepID=A0A834XFL8_9FABA|nr:uncharacterized protein G2W53_001308 [Senna tora]
MDLMNSLLNLVVPPTSLMMLAYALIIVGRDGMGHTLFAYAKGEIERNIY